MRFLLFVLLLGNLLKAQDLRQGLIVVHVDPASKSDFTQKIYSYHFVNGNYTGRDLLLSVQGKKDGKDLIRTDLGTPTLYKDRYLITGIGNIIDLKEKKILFDGRASLVRCSNDSAIFFTNDAFKGKFYSVYNFKTGQYGEVKQLAFKARTGQDVEFDKSGSSFRLYLYPPNKPKVELVKDAGFAQLAAAKTADPPLWWLDNASLVFGALNKENTEMTFFRVNVDSRQTTMLGKAKVSPGKEAAMVTRLNKDETVVALGGRQILVNAASGSVTDLAFSSPEFGFSYEIKAGPAGRTVKLNDKEIGKFHFQPKNFAASANIAALVKEIVMGDESYQQGMSVWNSAKSKWGNVDAEDILLVAGWISE